MIHQFNLRSPKLIDGLFRSFADKGLEGFFTSPDCVKEQLGISEGDIRGLEEEMVTCYRTERWEEAKQALQWLLFCEPLNSAHTLRLGMVLYKTGHFSEAVKILCTGLVLDSENPAFYLYLGLCHKALEEREKAREMFTVCMEITKGDKEASSMYTLAQESLASIAEKLL